MLPADARKSSQADGGDRGSANRKRVCGNSSPKGGKLDVCTARLPANHRRSRAGWREAHRKKVQKRCKSIKRGVLASPSSAQPQKALPGRPLLAVSRKANPAGVRPLRLASGLHTSTPHTPHLTPRTSHLTKPRIPCAPPPHTTRPRNRPLLILRRGAGCVIVGGGCDGTNSIDGSPTRGDASASSAHTIHWAGIMRSA